MLKSDGCSLTNTEWPDANVSTATVNLSELVDMLDYRTKKRR